MKMFPNLRRFLALVVDESTNRASLDQADAVGSSAHLAQPLQLPNTTRKSSGGRLGASVGVAVLRLRSLAVAARRLLEPRRYAPLATGCLILSVTGCANLGQMFQPPDPTIVRAENTAEIAEISVASFLKLQKATPDSSNLDAHLARSLAERFPQDLATMKGLLEAYKQTKSAYAKSALLPAVDAVKSAGDVAHSQLSAQPPIQNRYDSGFAPPITPQVDMNSLWVNIAEMRAMLSSNASQMEGLNLRVAEMDAKLVRLVSFRSTNSVPPLSVPTNVIPSRVP